MSLLKRRGVFVFFMFLALVVSIAPCRAEQERGSARTFHTTGFDFAYGVPLPSYVGAMVGVNFRELLRFSLGVGSMVHWLNYQANAKVFIFPNNFTPYLGGSFNYISGRSNTFLKYNLDLSRAFAPGLELGLDYTADSGFHMAANFGFAYIIGISIVMPGLAIGWYF